MNKPITIAVDAMGGDNSPDKVIEGISIHSIASKDVMLPCSLRCLRTKDVLVIFLSVTSLPSLSSYIFNKCLLITLSFCMAWCHVEGSIDKP